MPKWGLTLSVRGSTGAGGGNNTIAQMNSILNAIKNYALPRSFPGSTAQDYAVLAFGGTAITIASPKGVQEEIILQGIFGVRADTPANVTGRIDAVLGQFNFVEQSSFSVDKDLATMQAALQDRCGAEGCSKIWQILPTTDITTGVNNAADLQAKFQAIV